MANVRRALAQGPPPRHDAVVRTVTVTLAALLFATPARAQRFDCGSGVAGLDAVYLPAGDARAGAIRVAVLSFCASAAGRTRRYCGWVVPLVAESGCEIEFYRATRTSPARAALGKHGERPEWAWHVELRRAPGGWRVTRLYFDDLERP